MSRTQRPLSAVPAGVWLALGAAFLAHLALRAGSTASFAAAELPPPPRPAAMRLASLGESEAAARVAMLYLQAFDYRGTNALPYQRLDYARLEAWLEAILRLDPRSHYPLFAAARVYAEVPDAARTRRMLDFVHRAFQDAPHVRWPFLAHAALVAKHRLGDLALALRYAQDVQRHATAASVPAWARQMSIFILEDMNELEAARIMIGGLLESGHLTDPTEMRFLKERLEELEQRLARRDG